MMKIIGKSQAQIQGECKLLTQNFLKDPIKDKMHLDSRNQRISNCNHPGEIIWGKKNKNNGNTDKKINLIFKIQNYPNSRKEATESKNVKSRRMNLTL